MTRSDERGTRCLIVIKRPPCDNILASNLLLRPDPLPVNSNLSSYPESKPCVATDLNNLVQNRSSNQCQIFLSQNKPNVCFHQKIQINRIINMQLFFANQSLFCHCIDIYFPTCHLFINLLEVTFTEAFKKVTTGGRPICHTKIAMCFQILFCPFEF